MMPDLLANSRLLSLGAAFVFALVVCGSGGFSSALASGQNMLQAEDVDCSWKDLDSAKLGVTAKLNVLVSNHLLDDKHSRKFEQQLKSVEDSEAQLKPGYAEPTLVQFITLLREIRLLDTSINLIQEKKLETQAEIDARIAEAAGTIGDARQSKKLSIADGAELSSSLDEIRQVESGFKGSSNAALNQTQIESLATELDKLYRTMSEELSGVKDKPIVKDKIDDVSNAIKDALTDKSIGTQTGTSLQNQVTSIEKTLEAYKASDDGLTASELMIVVGQVDNLAARFEQAKGKSAN